MKAVLLGKLGKPEVCDLGLSTLHEHVGHLQISMDHVLLSQVDQSLEDVLDDGGGALLVEISVFPEA